MTLTNLINEINTLNAQGINESEAHNFSQAEFLHHEAAEKAKTPGLNPDYFLVSRANEGYALRHSTNDREKVMSLLEDSLKETSQTEFDSGTHFGEARVFEEIGLAMRYKHEGKEDLKNTLDVLNEAIQAYERAAEKPEEEIVSLNVIHNRLYRTIGITSTVASLAASASEGKEQALFAEAAIGYAREEIEARESDGQKEGFGLMNAYHTLGVALTEKITPEDDEAYGDAYEALEQAIKLTDENMGQEKSVLNLRMAWLHHKTAPTTNYEIIGKYLHETMQTVNKWTPAVKDALKNEMVTLSNFLGGDFKAKTDILYKE